MSMLYLLPWSIHFLNAATAVDHVGSNALKRAVFLHIDISDIEQRILLFLLYCG